MGILFVINTHSTRQAEIDFSSGKMVNSGQVLFSIGILRFVNMNNEVDYDFC